MSATVNEVRHTVTLTSGATLEVQVYSPGTSLAALHVEAVLNGATLRRVRDVNGTGSILYLSESAVKVDGALTVDKVGFDTAAGATATAEGELVWNATDKTLDLKVNSATLQVGQEFHLYGLNKSGVTIPDGSVVYLSGAQGERATVALGDASSLIHARSTIGIATEEILDNQQGFVTTQGLVRGLNTIAYTEGDPLFLSATVPGGLQTTPPPSPPNASVFVGMVVRSHATEGSIYVSIDDAGTIGDLSDVVTTGAVEGDVIGYDATTPAWRKKTPTVVSKQSMQVYVDRPVRGKELSIGGGMGKIIDAGAVSTGSPQAGTNGCGKLVLVVNAGSDLVGDITITGDTVDRNTGAITAGDTEVVTLAGASTDTSDTDAAGNTRHAFSGAYITTKWFQGAVSISTTEVNVSDMDVWNIAFHQFGDTPASVELDTFDVTGLATNIAAWLYGYTYSVEVTAGRCTIARQASIEIPAADIDAADVHYRRKIGSIGKTLTPSTDGVWTDLFPGPFNQTYWEDLTIILIYSATNSLTLS
jgi:hypothetical protein